MIRVYVFTLLFVVVCRSVPAQAADGLPWLRANGARIVDPRGQAVVLGGVNLGGWLVEEMWMMPFVTKPPEGSQFAEIKDHVSLWHVIEERFGAQKMRQIRTELRNNWITEADFDRIHAAGMNCVRLPFLYDMLEEPDGWSWLDRAINWAAARDMYVILDLHGAPGRQSGEHHTGEAGVNKLFSNPDFIAQTERVWTKVAQRYKNRPEVAAYDLMNEPTGASDDRALFQTQDRLYRAIRAVDARHLIIVEDGYKGIDHLPKPSEMEWKNVVLSYHSYNFDAKSEQDHAKHLDWLVAELQKNQKRWQAPFYLGEFNLEPHGTPTMMATYVRTMREHGWGWSLWTYKTMIPGGSGEQSMWGWYRCPRPVKEPLNPFADSADELLRKIGEVRTERLEEHVKLGQALKTPA